jgi:fused signal recognition particle receptor
MQRLIKNVNFIWNKFKNNKKLLWEELEEQMIEGDISVDTAARILQSVKSVSYSESINDPEKLKSLIRDEIIKILELNSCGELNLQGVPPAVFLIVGVNGSGKTTTVAKLASLFKNDGKKVLISAADTYRSAAVEQIQYYADKLGIDIVYHQRLSDPGAVVYDSIEKAKAKDVDIVIIDTAGRMQTSHNLMEELRKIKKVIKGRIGRDADEILLVIDSTTGQNAKSQAVLFNDSIGLTGVILTKTDSTSKGGIVLTIKNDLNLPVKIVTSGEKLEDIRYFDPVEFADSLFS